MPDWFQEIQRRFRIGLISTSRLIQEVKERDVALALDRYFQAQREDSPTVVFPGSSDSVELVRSQFKDAIQGIIEQEIYEIENQHVLLEIEELLAILNEDVVKDSETATDVLEQKIEELVNELDDEPYGYNRDFEYFEEFVELLNARLLFKTLSPDSGEFFGDSGVGRVPFSNLSSGEQHLLVMYHRLFTTEPDTLVMIDEPELSMNVVWQRNFLKDLQRIIELRKFDVLIATHSPQIIHDKWDWMVPLGEKVDD